VLNPEYVAAKCPFVYLPTLGTTEKFSVYSNVHLHCMSTGSLRCMFNHWAIVCSDNVLFHWGSTNNVHALHFLLTVHYIWISFHFNFVCLIGKGIDNSCIA
jgi:hypothetical protein